MLGTNYFVEKKFEDARTFVKGKLAYLQKNIDQLAQVIIAKKKQLNVINNVVQQRVQMMQQQQAKQPAK